MMKEFFNLAARPEIDTIRLYLKTDLQKCRLRAFFDNEFSREISTIEPMKDERGKPLTIDGKKIFKPIWEKKRLDFRFSSYSKMQVFEDVLRWGKKGEYGRSVICVEYSVPKYYAFTNGVNRGVCAELGGVHDFFEPVLEALKELNLYKYWDDTEENINEFLLNNFQIRRLDLSFNFRVPDVKTALIHLSACRLPKSVGEVKTRSREEVTEDGGENPQREGDFTSVSFGGHKGSAYKCIFYDKATEQKKLFQTFENDLSYENRREKKLWYKENKYKFDNIVRFETQFHFRFFVYHIPESKVKKGVKMAEKIINLCSGYWTMLLKRFDEQLNTLNHHTEEEYNATEKCLDRLEELNMLGDLSNTQFGTLSAFVQKCHKFGFDKVQKTMSKQLFSIHYNRVKKLTGFDIKVMCVKELPIMRIMPLSASWLERGLDSLYFDVPDYEQREAVGAVC